MNNIISRNYKININGDIINSRNKLMITRLTSGSLCVNLKIDNHIYKSWYVHRLVAMTYLNNDNNYPNIKHIDKNKMNNNVNNLQWCTFVQNLTHSRGKKVNQIDKDTGVIINSFDSISDAYKSFGTIININKMCKGDRQTAHGYKWKYVK